MSHITEEDQTYPQMPIQQHCNVVPPPEDDGSALPEKTRFTACSLVPPPVRTHAAYNTNSVYCHNQKIIYACSLICIRPL